MKFFGDSFHSWRKVMSGFALVAVVGITAIAMYAIKADDRLSVFAAAVLIGSASVVTGGLLGFLFGVPRTRTADSAVPTGQQAPDAGIYANTNLEQISDWLTKILVGVTLVQLGTIGSGAKRLFSALGPSLGSRESSPAFAGALVIFGGVAGFLLGWLITRLFLGRAMSEADILNEAAAAAKQRGDLDAAKKYEDMAANLR